MLKAYVEELRSVLTDTERIAGKWGKDDKVVSGVGFCMICVMVFVYSKHGCCL